MTEYVLSFIDILFNTVSSISSYILSGITFICKFLIDMPLYIYYVLEGFPFYISSILFGLFSLIIFTIFFSIYRKVVG